MFRLPSGLRFVRPRAALVALTVAGSGFLGGCSDNCGLGSQLNGIEYEVFVKALQYEFQNEAAFPGEASPANGFMTLAFEWGTANEGPVTVFMDGQPFQGTGTFDAQECGNFVAQWEGEYLHESGSEHAFAAAALFLFYDTVLEGQLNYAENFRTVDDKVGSFNVEIGEIRGLQAGASAGTATQ